MVEQTYRYLEPSAVTLSGAAADLTLSTSGGRDVRGGAAHPHFFDGVLAHGEQTAAALLVVARVARTRFYVPPGMLAAVLRAADPVVTSNGDRLRFESFSACGGVYARLDVLPGALDGPALSSGTTNVDVNPPLRQALARVGAGQSLHLAVGRDVTVTTAHASVTEEKVPLPERWLRGFAEVQLAAAGMQQVLDVAAVEARRFVRALPRPSGARSAPLWAVPSRRGLRLTGAPGPSGVSLTGPERLRVVEPLLRFATGLRAYAPAGGDPARPAPSVWELTMPDARLVLTLSPETSRGFSGEGGVLRDLLDPRSAADTDLVSVLLAYEPRIDVAALAAGAGLSPGRVLRALGRLGAAGRVGYDAAEGAYFHRELPYDPATLDAMHPRLVDARALVESGAVALDGGVALEDGAAVDRHAAVDGDVAADGGAAVDGGVARVTSGGQTYVVRRTAGGHRCTCPWSARHREDRGPCKHVLAVELRAALTSRRRWA